MTGPSDLSVIDKAIDRSDVESAEEMYNACMKDFSDMDIIVMSAAVADFRPDVSADKKISKKNNTLSLSLVPTQDILKNMGEKKNKNQVLVGFALETDNEHANAKDKLERKNLDLIVLNSLNDSGAGFDVDTNIVTFIERSGKERSFNKKLKTEVAKDLVDAIMDSLKK